MANTGQTMFRFCGALLLAGGATLVDHPSMLKEEPIVPSRVVAQGPPSGLEVSITQGKRAFSIPITNDVASLAGMFGPNSRVDIMVVIDDPNNPGKRATKRFMENLRLLAIGSVAERTKDGRPINTAVATIEVTPEEAKRLAVATSQGSLQLVLRGVSDPNPRSPRTTP